MKSNFTSVKILIRNYKSNLLFLMMTFRIFLPLVSLLLNEPSKFAPLRRDQTHFQARLVLSAQDPFTGDSLSQKLLTPSVLELTLIP
jgi:hypothetical protein